MGLFSFLTKKGSSIAPEDELQVKGQAYSSTAIALPPIRGNLPVLGNGPNTLADLKRAARKRSEQQLSNPAPSIDLSAPPPIVSRLRSMSLGRPNTAPTSGTADTSARPRSSGRSSRSRSRRDSRPQAPPPPPKTAPRPASNFIVNKSKGPPYLLGVTGPDDGSLDNPLPPVPPMPAHYKQESIISGSASFTGSVPGSPKVPESIASSRNLAAAGASSGHVDILDASGALKPADFKTRIRAAGARDYGEDVADRNIGVNGTNISSPAVIAFYALTGGRPLAYQSDGSAVDVRGRKYAPDAIPVHLKNMDQDKDKDELLEHATRTMRQPTFPARTTSLDHRNSVSAAGELAVAGDKSLSGPSGRPKSVHERAMSPKARGKKPRPLSMHPVIFNHKEEAAVVPDIPRSRPGTGSHSGSGSRPGTGASAGPPEPPPKSPSRLTASSSAPWPRSSNVTSDKGDESSLRSIARKKNLTIPPSSNYEDAAESEDNQTPRGRTSFSNPAKKTFDDTHSHGHLNYDDADSAANGDTVPFPHLFSPPGSAGARHDSRPSSQHSWRAPSGNFEQIPPSISRSSSASRSRNRSLGGTSARGRSQLDDISEYIPHRRSSRAQGSISSTTPTTVSSIQSSNAPPRPHSRHTADTSIDLTYSLPAAQQHYQQHIQQQRKFGHTRGKSSGNTVGTSNSARTANTFNYQAQRANVPSSLSHQRKGTNDGQQNDAEAYTSTSDGSDVDSYLENKTRRRPKDGEHLLFKDGAYGETGHGLPGLFDFDENGLAPPPVWSTARKQADRAQTQSLDDPRPSTAPKELQSYDNGYYGHPQPPTLPSFPLWDDTSDTTSEPDFDILRRAHDLALGSNGQGGGLLSGGMLSDYDPMEEEYDEQLEAKLAMRLRKEIKRRERVAARRQTLSKRATMDVRDQGTRADVEP